MPYCKDLKKEFATKGEMFAELKTNKKILIDAKKATIKKSDAMSFSFRPIGAAKAAGAPLAFGDYIYPVINSTNYLDSHQDVHIDGIWNKSAKEQAGSIYYIINHDLELGKVISYPNEVDIIIKQLAWRDLGKDYDGSTECLIYKAKVTAKSNNDAFIAFKEQQPIQNSVRMLYVTMYLCIDSNDDDFAQEKSQFNKYLPVIINKEQAIEDGYFWAVTEAKIYKEGSAVLEGSNDATTVLYDLKNIAAASSTATSRATTQKRAQLNNILKTLKK